MPALKNRIKKLERAFSGARIYTDDQWDGIFLVLLSPAFPEHIVALMRTAAIYPWAAQWYARKEEERRHWSREERKCAANRQLPDHLWDAFFRRIAKAWQRQIPDAPCSLAVVDGKLCAIQSAAPEQSARISND